MMKRAKNNVSKNLEREYEYEYEHSHQKSEKKTQTFRISFDLRQFLSIVFQTSLISHVDQCQKHLSLLLQFNKIITQTY